MADNHSITFTTEAGSPFRLDLTVWALRRRDKNQIDQWDGRYYQRIVVIGGHPVRLQVIQSGHGLQLVVRAESHSDIKEGEQVQLEQLVRKMLGLDVQMAPFYRLAEHNETLRPLAKQFLGLRPPRFPSIFETLVNAIACQQVSLESGIAALNRLAGTFGSEFSGGNQVWHAFPEPGELAGCSESDLKECGLSGQKALAIRQLAVSIASGELNLEGLETQDSEVISSRLQKLKGVGRWSTEYTLLRGYGRLDSFPGDDIGGQNSIQALLALKVRPDYAALKTLTAKWHPYEGLMYLHLLLAGLSLKLPDLYQILPERY